MKKFLGGEKESTDRSVGDHAPSTSFYITDKAYNMAVSRIDDRHFNSSSSCVTENKVYKRIRVGRATETGSQVSVNIRFCTNAAVKRNITAPIGN